MAKMRTILCGLMCTILVVAIFGCGESGGGKPGVGTKPGTGNRGQTGNSGGKKPIPPRDPAKEKRAALNDTEWDIDVVRMSDAERKKEPDKLRFVNNRVYIEKFDAQGYNASNYSLRVQPDGVVVWETMQTSEDGSSLFLRGDCRGERMNGVIVKHPKNGKNEDFTFVSTGSRKLDKTILESKKAE